MATATGYMDESSDDQYPYSLVREALHDSCSTSGICKPQTAWLVRGFLATRLILPSIFKILDWEIHCMVCPHASRVLTRVPLPVYVNPKLHDMCRGFWRLALFCLQFFRIWAEQYIAWSVRMPLLFWPVLFWKLPLYLPLWYDSCFGLFGRSLVFNARGGGELVTRGSNGWHVIWPLSLQCCKWAIHDSCNASSMWTDSAHDGIAFWPL